MSVYSKRIRIIIVGVVLTICVVGGTMAFQNDAKSMINQSLTNLPSYPENENGQTYGSDEEATSVEMLSDLIYGGSVNGIKGYVLKKDYLGELSRNVPLYDVDGVNIIGSLYISPKNMNYSKNKHGNTVSEDAPNYPVNEQGQTYSNGPFPAGGQGPDLIRATGENGVDGYVKSSDLIPQVSSPEEAIAYMESIENVDYIPIPLYKSDGKTVIGEFRLGN